MTTSTISPPDIIDEFLGTAAAATLAEVRDARPDARANAQRSFDALFSPVDDSEISLAERWAVAAFAVGLHGEDVLGPYYFAQYAALGALPAESEALGAQVAAGRTSGPYGSYREANLAKESTDGLRFTVPSAEREILGERLTAALEHAHLLVFRPRESSPEALDALLAAGWSTTGIVTLSQLIAFLAFQVRVVHGLAKLASDIQDGSNR